jgi:hypothetical protein
VAVEAQHGGRGPLQPELHLVVQAQRHYLQQGEKGGGSGHGSVCSLTNPTRTCSCSHRNTAPHKNRCQARRTLIGRAAILLVNTPAAGTPAGSHAAAAAGGC